jgi:GAF domain
MDQRRLERLLGALHDADESSSVLRRICLVGRDSFSVAGAGLSRIVDGRHEMVEASDARATDIEALQVTFGEGPCLEAVTSFRPCLEPDLASASARQRWPMFAPGAVDRGVAAAFAFPLITGGVAVGAFDLYASSAGALHPEQFDDALLLAGLAALAVDQGVGGTAIEGVGIRAEPAEPWAHSAVVHNACGMVSEQLGIEVDEALLRLRAVAFATDRPMAAIAKDVVARRLRIESWAAR